MSKIEKFFRDPTAFFRDAANNRRATSRTGTPTYVVGFSTWKQYLRKFFPDRNLTFLPREISEHEFKLVWQNKISSDRNAEMFIWGFKAPAYILEFIKKNNVKAVFVEDGFVRSVQLGASKAPPMSLCMDSRTPYFNSREASDLEVLLNTYNFSADSEILTRADSALKLLLESGVSKYNYAAPVDVDRIYGPKTSERILVIGQVEDDASIEFGCERKLTNNDIVRIAAQENVGAQIIYKPHPDVLEGHRAEQSNPADVADIAQILAEKMPMAQALATIDHVYTITSLAGFEALLRGIRVTVMGAPFYSGWGLTDDRQATPRRTRKLAVNQLFAGAYLLYPKYFDPLTGARQEFEDIVATIHAAYSSAPPAAPLAPQRMQTSMAPPKPAPVRPDLTPTFLLGDLNYKSLLSCWFDARKFGQIPAKTTEVDFVAKFKKSLDNNKFAEFYVLEECKPFLKKYIDASGKNITYLSEGFIRSVELDATKEPPYSLLLDRKAPHYDARQPSDLEEILNGYDFEADTALLARSEQLLKQLLTSGLSKYNHVAPLPEIDAAFGIKDRPRVLVLGQVEDAPSMRLANPRNYSNNDLVTIAAMENPGAQIIFKPHPCVLNGLAKTMSDPDKVAHMCQVLTQDLPLAQALETVDHVYTISSLGGFEALLRGIPVTTLGLPFYAGWGLGDDRQQITRRRRTLSVDQVFAAAYVLYPIYVDPIYKMTVTPETVLKRLVEEVALAALARKYAVPTVVASVASAPVTTFVLGDISYRALLGSWFSNRKFSQIPSKTTNVEFVAKFKKALDANKRVEFFVAEDCPLYLLKYAQASGRKITYLNSGFICFTALDAQKLPPYSLLLDSKSPFYDASRRSDLEALLSDYDFDADTVLLERAERVLAQWLDSGLSKYNHPVRAAGLLAIYGVKSRPRVLVLGQVEDAPSVRLANPRNYTNNDVVAIAAMENPGAQIIFKPHPKIINNLRKTISDPRKVAHLCQILQEDLPLAQALETIDHVYCISSIGGFEAILRGIKTTTLGIPFYSGWGLCDDRETLERRQRPLTPLQVFSAAYILYPVYVDPLYRKRITAETVISRLQVARTEKQSRPLMEDTISMAPAVLPKPVAVSGIPDWFQSHIGPELRRTLDVGRPVFLYFPWIAEHGDMLISRIDGGDEYALAAFDLVKGIDDNNVRKSVNQFVRGNPELYRKMVARRLVPLRNKTKGFLLTFDWAPVMRIIASVCRDLGIPTILIPHESVFVDREKYYWDMTAKASIPTADVILGWGGLQRDIFLERGYPAERFIAVGAPKFDTYVNYRPQLDHTQFCNLFGLSPNKKIILFATQPLDSQLDQKKARNSQRQALADLLSYSVENDCQLLVRLPPSKDDVVGAPLKSQLLASGLGAVDDATCYLVSPEEALFHSDVVTSVNSTMLFEGLLLGRPALSLKYVQFEQVWERVGIPTATSLEELRPVLDMMLVGEWTPPAEGMRWAADMFGIGRFDGHAAQRIRGHLSTWASAHEEHQLTMSGNALERLFSKSYLDVIAIPSSSETLNSSQKYFQGMLNARHIESSKDASMDAMASVEIFFQWGITPSSTKRAQRGIATALGRPVIFVEDGFIRSVDIGLSGEPGMAVILDDTTAYYDATKVSRLERLLQHGLTLNTQQCERAKRAIEKIVVARVSKYNHAPDVPLQIGGEGRKKVLLIDQRFGDQSVASGLADESTYEQMLYDAIRTLPDHDIIVKQHPDAIKGGKSSYFSHERLAKYSHLTKNLYTINFDVNPFALFDLVDEVFVGTSGMGFEALMAGKKVRCYGMPFYAGWGLTDDKIHLARRSRVRSVEDIFHFAYVESSRYFRPDLNVSVEVEEMVDYIVEKRGW